MANLINRGFNGAGANATPNGTIPNGSIPNMQGINIPQGGMSPQNIKTMLQNPQVKQQIQQMYKAFNGDPNALMQSLIQQNPAFKNNPMLQMIMQGRNNPNGILGAMGLTQQDFADIMNG